MLPRHIPNALTVDVEDYFQVSAFEDRISRSQWDRYESRVESNTDRLLALFDQCEVRGTFFVLGWVAQRYPTLIRRIAQAGHEIASHGYWHRLVYDLTPESFGQDLEASREAIADACGICVTAYRAPSFSITAKSLWALEVLVEHGFTLDSSIFPISGHDRYGMPEARPEIHDLSTQAGCLQEFPPSAWRRGRLSIPIGGGYFRLFPLQLTLQAISAVRRRGRPAMFYIHPWEIDQDQPPVAGISRKTHFRHYTGLSRTYHKLKQLITRHPFGTTKQVLQHCGSPAS